MTRQRGERGQSLVELALVIPIFFILVFGIVDFGLGLKAWITITNSAREAARYAAVTCAATGGTAAAVEARAVDAASLSDFTTANVEVDAEGEDTDNGANTGCPGASADSIIVTVYYDYEFITPLGGMLEILGGGLPNSVEIGSSSDMRLE